MHIKKNLEEIKGELCDQEISKLDEQKKWKSSKATSRLTIWDNSGTLALILIFGSEGKLERNKLQQALKNLKMFQPILQQLLIVT